MILVLPSYLPPSLLFFLTVNTDCSKQVISSPGSKAATFHAFPSPGRTTALKELEGGGVRGWLQATPTALMPSVAVLHFLYIFDHFPEF